MHIAQKFEALLEKYRRPDGRRWSGQEIDEATGGVVTRSYVTNLRKGRIENPGYAKLAAMAKAMGFPPEVWFEDGLNLKRSIVQAGESRCVAGRLEHVYEVIRNPKTGEPYTNAEVARMTLGDLTEEEVERKGPAPSATRVWARSQRWLASWVWNLLISWIGENRRYSMKSSWRRCEMRMCEI
jgi:hypothetical protein